MLSLRIVLNLHSLLKYFIFTLLAAFRINMWTRARERRFLSHRLCSRIKAFDWKRILHGNAGALGGYKELSVLPDKIARYMYGYHADDYTAHGLDRHGILKHHRVVNLS
jgi:hypothetical protein